MKENQVTFERIRSYILGKMTETESSSFEAELAQDPRLRGEYERLKEIASAADSISYEESIRSVLKQAEEDLSFQNRVVDEKKLKEDLLIAERELDKLEGRGFWHHLKDILIHCSNTVRDMFSPASYSNITRLAIAACVCLVGFMVFLGIDAQRVGYSYSQFTGTRGTSEIEALMEMKDNKAAIAKIAETREWLEDEIENPMYDDQIYLDNLRIQEQELDFLEAICQLRRWHYFSGKKSLTKIANDGGVYAKEAQDLLEKL